ncbi:MAG: glycerol-3-phosphate acyltransferase [Candidatus Heimdallarchaeota archaeon]|nr:glycerol-3-phosphate acyltransferase [Candidatus Heimdallarchaeota archaeon]
MASIIWQFFVAPLIGAAIGGIPTSFIICKLVKGIDPREFGSGSVSTRNAIRAAGFWPWGLMVGAFDLIKGAGACAIVEYALARNHPNLDYLVVLTALAAIASHCWMPYLGFKGGKGLATMGGTLMYFYWPVGPFIFPLLIVLLSLLSGFSGIGSVWGVSFISPIFFILDLIGPGTQIIQPFPHSYVLDVDGYGIPFTIVYSFGVLFIILLRYLPELKKIKSGEAKTWSKLNSAEVMK